VTGSVEGEFLAADAYPQWKRRVKAAQKSVRVYSPYLDDLVVRLLGNSILLAGCLSVVTDLSPESGTHTYRRQLLAIRRLLNERVEVRSLPRLHAKVLLVDGASVTVGSQNFTSYARHSKETTAVPALGMSESSFVETLQRWYEMAEPVELGLIEKLLDELTEPLQTAQAAIESLTTEYEKAVADYRETQRLLEQQRLERAAAMARAEAAAAALLRAAAASPYSPVGQEVAHASLTLDSTCNWTLMADPGVDLTNWSGFDASGRWDAIKLERLYFYPVLLGPGMRMAFARVGRTRITYTFRRPHGFDVTIKDIPLRFALSCPDNGPDDANLVVTFHWRSQRDGDSHGYQVSFRFDGERAERIAEGPIGSGRGVDLLTTLFQPISEDPEEWGAILRTVLAPKRLEGFIQKKNADSFFPHGKWLRVNAIRFAGTPVLLIQ
jgi:hypothetical protein